MPLEPGTRLGPYEIISPIGAGGMGEVHRARDTRLDRTVAIKVLTGAMAADAESRDRFEQEARAIAALNDPHICTIHDVGRHGALDYLVLEYLEGETLAARLRRSPPLSIDETLAIAILIADALHRAHRAGVVHRDLKPGNVMLVRRAGQSAAPDVKLLDFGLASRTSVSKPQALDASLVATMASSMAATRPPTATASGSQFSGTIQYMAPEQLDGDAGDARADIFAFGCVLYEMLAGRKPFEGATAVTVIASIMSSEPKRIDALRSHPLLEHVLTRCLDKDRERRWQDIADVAGELRWIASQPRDVPAPGAAPASRNRIRALAAALAVALGLLAIAGTLLIVRRQPAPPDTPALQLEVSTAPTDDPTMALSPDGTQLAFIANRQRRPMLWVRSLDSIESRALPGTEGASYPFWSPDQRSIGFFADGKLKRTDLEGGRPLVIADATNGRGGTWSSDGVILFAPDVSGPLLRVSTRGGAVESVMPSGDPSGPDHRWPQFLPDGKRFLYSSTLGEAANNGIWVGSLDRTQPVRVMDGEQSGRFAAPDRLLTVVQSTLQAYKFDAASGKVQGEPQTIAQGFAGGAGSIAVSGNGALAYRAGTAQRRQLVWVDRQGGAAQAVGEPAADDLGSPELSPDEQSVVVFSHRGGGENDVWVIDLARNLVRRVTNGPPADAHPIWDPDGRHVVFFSSRLGPRGPVRQSLADGKIESLVSERGVALSWTRDRLFVLLRRAGEKSGEDLVAAATTGSARIVPVAQSAHNETEGQFSPDGKAVAFVSNESGHSEVFVQAFPDAQGRTQVSTAGGTQVRWSSDGKEIFYVAPDGKMMAVTVTGSAAALKIGSPVALFQTYLATGTNVVGNKPQYAVSRSGRFLLNTAVETPSAPIVVSLNWMKTLAR
ncbi:MAG TPA: protein kinase [Vicinamibacterales bacterium]|nr:protein kinase [Vicinamibacterales bacterium]